MALNMYKWIVFHVLPIIDDYHMDDTYLIIFIGDHLFVSSIAMYNAHAIGFDMDNL